MLIPARLNPFAYRPEAHVDPDDDWEDNWLSNAMAWASQVFTPKWCTTPEHWTSRVTGYLFTTCPCCLVLRGFIIGAVAGAILGFLVGGLM